jgi:hypothetical protein
MMIARVKQCSFNLFGRKNMCAGEKPSDGGGVDGGGGKGGEGGEGGVTFTLPGLGREIKPGDSLTAAEAQAIAAASNGQLKFDGQTLTGNNPDGSGAVNIQVGQPLDVGQIHDLHHTVASSGGAGNDGGTGSPAPMNGGGGHHH